MKGRQLIDTLKSYLAAAPAAPMVREAARISPIPESTKYLAPNLDAGFDKHLDDIKPGAKMSYGVHENTPQGATVLDRVKEVIANPNRFASSTSVGESPAIAINPNSDRALYAHELGHLASQQTDVGHLAASLRANPKLQKALLGSLMVLPGAAAVFEEGDNDLDSSMALAALSAAPKLIDEGLATRHGLAIMDKANLRASMGQRGKLAAGLLSYLAPAAVVGLGANIVGNQFD